MSKKFWILTLIVLAGFAGFAVFKGDGQTTLGDVPVHSIGDQNSTVKFIEYGDFQCSACAAYFPVVEQVIEKYKDRVSFEYRHYPLTTIHQNAFASARAAEAAGKQGKFWEMYRALYTNQSSWAQSSGSISVFSGYADKLGLDLKKFEKDFIAAETNDGINASIREFNLRKLPKSTPTFMLNGKRIQPGNNLKDFDQLIDAELAK